MKLSCFVFLIYFFSALSFADNQTAFQKAVSAFEQQDYATALKELRPLAEKGDAQSQYALGMMYENGFGVTKDLSAARSWYTKAATQGNTDAQFNLGAMNEKGIGAPKNYAAAAKYYRLAAAQGDIDAFNNLGFLYQQGLGVKQNKIVALALYNVSVALEKENAQNSQAAKNRQIIANQMPLPDVQTALTLTSNMMQSAKPLEAMDAYLKTPTLLQNSNSFK